MNDVSTCPVCRSPSRKLLFNSYSFDDPAAPFDIVRCDSCELVRVEPFPTPEKLRAYYAPAYYGSGQQAKFSGPVEALVRFENDLRAQKLLEFLPSGIDRSSARILDVGCGRGTFLRALHRLGCDCVGIDVDTFPLPHSQLRLSFQHGTMESATFPDESFQAVSIWHVLEHTENPRSTVKRASELLASGGIVAIAVPNFSSTQAALFKGHWFHLDLPRHLYQLSRDSLLNLLSSAGLEPVAIRTQAWDQNLFGFVQSALNWIVPKRANWFYTVLKGGGLRHITTAELPLALFHALAVPLLLVSAVFENIASVVFGRGATLIVYARKDS